MSDNLPTSGIRCHSKVGNSKAFKTCQNNEGFSRLHFMCDGEVLKGRESISLSHSERGVASKIGREVGPNV